ncbi:Tat pathway signal sequence domain protein [Sphingomonas montana]|uniref:exo-rhamnogalacturonan lyase family protein n=1 Tax=Sphingomonas montana TaxID=1843236 RepID=UPI00096F06BE|nr:Tat pathway signal sequence domain protein [Sphingomonas montana]
MNRTRITRRAALRTTMLAGAAAAMPGKGFAARPSVPAPAAPVRWIDGVAPVLNAGHTFGVPWPEGSLRRGRALTVRDGAGRGVPSQAWPTAYWPDGSVKWTAHALAAGAVGDALVVVPGTPARPADPVRVRQTADAVFVATGALEWEIGRTGSALVRAARIDGRIVVGATELVAMLATDAAGRTRSDLTGTIDRVVVEQTGPVRAVVRLEGMHAGAGRRMLPFVVRLYAYAGATSLRIVHSFVHDGDPAKDFIAALGVRVGVPMAGALHDRHLRLATGNGGMFAEGVRPLTGLRRDPGKAFRVAQVEGRAVPPLAEMAPAVRDVLDRIPAWSDVSLAQLSARGFTIAKRTHAGQGWIAAGEGARATGLGYVGSPTGGAALASRWFWERHPSQIDIRDAAAERATLTAWLWSPDAAPMDLRPYRDTMGMEGFAAQNEGLAVTYEDYEPGWDSATGTARTSELTLWACAATPPTATLLAMADMVATPPQAMVVPARIHAAGVFGDWGLPDRSTPNRRMVEDQLANLIDFYAGEVDRRSWYGFWNHGDVMHSYDADRHQWRYDIGGFAWANSELSPDLWLWYSALRTGDATTFRLAEAMTRHTGEVDVYHLGRFRGMGTRHGVQHWSDSSKQPRVSNAAYRRIFYYLTADERVGDLMHALIDSDRTLSAVDIGRKVPGAVHAALPAGTIEMSFGTTWATLAGAWLTEWERTGDRRWCDRLFAGMDTIGRMPRGWMTGSAPFDLATGRFRDPGDRIRLSHLNAVFGAVEISAELIRLIDNPGYKAAWTEYCTWYNAPQAEYLAKFGGRFGPRNLREGHSRLTAYAAQQSSDAALAARAAGEFASGVAGLGTVAGDPRIRLPGGVVEWPNVSTNAASQWGLAAIQLLALVPTALDGATLPTVVRRSQTGGAE